MSGYRTRDYWTWRSLKFGPSYVGPRSDEEASEAEAKLFVVV